MKLKLINLKYIALSAYSILIFCACNNWLDEKPDVSLVVPKTIEDYEAIIENSDQLFNINQPALGELSSDDYKISTESWESSPTVTEKNAYVWAEDPFQGTSCPDWNDSYNRIMTANIILEGIEKIKPNENDGSQKNKWGYIKGAALVFRSFAYYNLTQIFCKPYDNGTAGKDLGLPLKLSSNVNDKIARATLKETYDQVFSDLMQAKELLPAQTNYPTMPSKTAVYAILSRIYMSMEDYENAYLYSDLCLDQKSTLLDYNTLDSTANSPIQPFCPEDIFHTDLTRYTALLFTNTAQIDSTLYNSYNYNDLRKAIFFWNSSGVLRFKGSYSNRTRAFAGLAVDEIILNRAECLARKNLANLALQDLNTLLIKRYRTGTFQPLSGLTSNEALKVILLERRKELLFRGVRWSDLRRLNKNPQLAVTLTRTINGQTYTLVPNDVKYVFPIPPDEILLSGIEQNPR